MFYKVFKNKATATYKVGEKIEENGYYVCVPCGYKKFLKVGMSFPSCIKCLGEKTIKKMFKRGLELWERAYED